MGVASKWTRHKKRAFLKALRNTGVVTSAVEAVGLSRSSAYQLRKVDEAFRQAWDDAIQAAIDELELELRRRAMHGVEQPVYYGGKECGRIRTYNDNLGMFLLRVRRGVLPEEGQGGSGQGTGNAAEQTVTDPEGPGPRELIEARLRRLAGEDGRPAEPGAGGAAAPGNAADGSLGDRASARRRTGTAAGGDA